MPARYPALPFTYLTAAHRISCRIADISVNDDSAVVHGIADSVLRIAVDGDFGAAEICAESIARYTVDIDTFAAHTGSNESLTETSDYSAIAVRFPDLFVKFGKSEPFRINYHYYTTPPSFFLH